MIGPSSSHTAGAARIAKVARDIVGKEFFKVNFYLHGSFAKTYKGHGTDKALVAGILGMEPYDENLKNSINIAKNKGIDFNFIESDLGYQHSNTVKIEFFKNNGKVVYIIGSSIGGGNILITNIDGYKVKFTGEYPTILIKHKDKKGIISKISTILANNNINIASMKVTRKNKGLEVSTIIETDDVLSECVLEKIKSSEDIVYVTFINPIKEDDTYVQ